MASRNFYKILQVDPPAKPEVIVVAYKRLAMKYHPDTNKSPEANARMQAINEAYVILKDPEKRAKYDREGDFQSGNIDADERDKREKAAHARQRAEYEQKRREQDEAQRRRAEYERQKPRPKPAGDLQGRPWPKNLPFVLWAIFLLIVGLSNLGIYLPIMSPLLGIMGILAGISFLRTNEIPKNFGFMMLSGILIYSGLTMFINNLSGDFFFTLAGIANVLAGIFFIRQPEMRKNLGLMAGSGFLILNGLAAFGIVPYEIVFGILPLSAAALLFIGK